MKYKLTAQQYKRWLVTGELPPVSQEARSQLLRMFQSWQRNKRDIKWAEKVKKSNPPKSLGGG